MGVLEYGLGALQPVASTVIIIVFILVGLNVPTQFTILFLALFLFAAPASAYAQSDIPYYQACTNYATLSSCTARRTASCTNIRDVFESDPEWAQYRQRLCNPQLQTASYNRLLTSYNPGDCVYGECDAQCIADLQDIQLTILGYGCPADSVGVGVDTLVEVTDNIGITPVSGDAFRIMGWIGVALAIFLLALRAGEAIGLASFFTRSK
nr:hypothetical protein [Sicyoidochytrium minutum DNA virus]